MKAASMVPNRVGEVFTPFDYTCQRIGGRLGRAIDNNFRNGLLRIAYHDYIDAYKPGFPALWPSGEYLGKFMVGLAKGFRYSAEPEALAIMQRIVNAWVGAQERDGYLGTSTLGYGVGPRWGEWALWDHKYTLIGLIEYLRTVRYEPALACATRIGDMLAARCEENLEFLGPNHGGLADGSILEPMVDLYRVTGDPRHLKVCERILREFETEGNPRIVSELTQRSGRVDKVGTAKGYEMLSCIIGIIRMYQLTGRKVYLRTAEIAWDDIARYRLYITGTATAHEKFHDNHALEAIQTSNMGEGCVSAHWIYLSRYLFNLTGDPKYADALETSLLNHLLSSQSPWSAYQSYYMPLIGRKRYNRPSLHSNEPPCCVSSVHRVMAEIPEVVWTRNAANGMAILVYTTGSLNASLRTENGQEVRVKVEMKTDYPADGAVDIRVNPETPAKFRLLLRAPGWATRFEAKCGGKTVRGKPGQFVALDRRWRAGDEVRLTMDMPVVLLSGAPKYDGFHAVKRGPLVLSVGSDVNPDMDIDAVRIAAAKKPLLKPAADRLPSNWIGGQAYTCASVKAPDGRLPLLVPFADTAQLCNRYPYRVWLEEKK